MDDLNREAGICPFCGAKVEPHWALCDSCGQRLPWAPPKKQKTLDELTDEELATRFAPSRDNAVPEWARFMRSTRGKIAIMIAASFLWEFLNRLFFHLY